MHASECKQQPQHRQAALLLVPADLTSAVSCASVTLSALGTYPTRFRSHLKASFWGAFASLGLQPERQAL